MVAEGKAASHTHIPVWVSSTFVAFADQKQWSNTMTLAFAIVQWVTNVPALLLCAWSLFLLHRTAQYRSQLIVVILMILFVVFYSESVTIEDIDESYRQWMCGLDYLVMCLAAWWSNASMMDYFVKQHANPYYSRVWRVKAVIITVGTLQSAIGFIAIRSVMPTVTSLEWIYVASSLLLLSASFITYLCVVLCVRRSLPQMQQSTELLQRNVSVMSVNGDILPRDTRFVETESTDGMPVSAELRYELRCDAFVSVLWAVFFPVSLVVEIAVQLANENADERNPVLLALIHKGSITFMFLCISIMCVLKQRVYKRESGANRKHDSNPKSMTTKNLITGGNGTLTISGAVIPLKPQLDEILAHASAEKMTPLSTIPTTSASDLTLRRPGSSLSVPNWCLDWNNPLVYLPLNCMGMWNTSLAIIDILISVKSTIGRQLKNVETSLCECMAKFAQEETAADSTATIEAFGAYVTKRQNYCKIPSRHAVAMIDKLQSMSHRTLTAMLSACFTYITIQYATCVVSAPEGVPGHLSDCIIFASEWLHWTLFLSKPQQNDRISLRLVSFLAKVKYVCTRGDIESRPDNLARVMTEFKDIVGIMCVHSKLMIVPTSREIVSHIKTLPTVTPDTWLIPNRWPSDKWIDYYLGMLNQNGVHGMSQSDYGANVSSFDLEDIQSLSDGGGPAIGRSRAELSGACRFLYSDLLEKGNLIDTWNALGSMSRSLSIVALLQCLHALLVDRIVYWQIVIQCDGYVIPVCRIIASMCKVKTNEVPIFDIPLCELGVKLLLILQKAIVFWKCVHEKSNMPLACMVPLIQAWVSIELRGQRALVSQIATCVSKYQLIATAVGYAREEVVNKLTGNVSYAAANLQVLCDQWMQCYLCGTYSMPPKGYGEMSAMGSSDGAAQPVVGHIIALNDPALRALRACNTALAQSLSQHIGLMPLSFLSVSLGSEATIAELCQWVEDQCMAGDVSSMADRLLLSNIFEFLMAIYTLFCVERVHGMPMSAAFPSYVRGKFEAACAGLISRWVASQPLYVSSDARDRSMSETAIVLPFQSAILPLTVANPWRRDASIDGAINRSASKTHEHKRTYSPLPMASDAEPPEDGEDGDMDDDTDHEPDKVMQMRHTVIPITEQDLGFTEPPPADYDRVATATEEEPP